MINGNSLFVNTLLCVVTSLGAFAFGLWVAKYPLGSTRRIKRELEAYEDLWYSHVMRTMGNPPSNHDTSILRLKLVGWFNTGGLSLVERNILQEIDYITETSKEVPKPEKSKVKVKTTDK